MAPSPSHQFGQLIGELFEEFVEILLRKFVKNHQGLYLDCHNNTRPARKGKKLSWVDDKGNVHDLDFVIEKNGTDDSVGSPVGFIESAWRRYTKHSRNKAQKIQAAILPLADKYRNFNPFLGIFLAGMFTDNSLHQLQSSGFSILYFPYDRLITIFRRVGIDIFYDENTPDSDFVLRIETLRKKAAIERQKLFSKFESDFHSEISDFKNRLRIHCTRQIVRATILPLFGTMYSFMTVNDALSFLNSFSNSTSHIDFERFEIQLSFSNGDEIKASFRMKKDAVDFLHEHLI